MNGRFCAHTVLLKHGELFSKEISLGQAFSDKHQQQASREFFLTIPGPASKCWAQRQIEAGLAEDCSVNLHSMASDKGNE